MGGERDCGVSVDVPGAQQRSLSRPCPVLGGRRWRRTGPGVCRGGGGWWTMETPIFLPEPRAPFGSRAHNSFRPQAAGGVGLGEH